MTHVQTDSGSTAGTPPAAFTIAPDPAPPSPIVVTDQAVHPGPMLSTDATADATPVPAAAAGLHAPRPLPDTTQRLLVMGIVNRTPDSFFDQGLTYDLPAAVAAGIAAAADGADIIDVGGVKFAPGDPLPVDQEIDRVIPVVDALRAQLPEVLLSVDTFHADVAAAAIGVGADIINDTTGLSDPRMAEVVARGGASVILCHSLARPREPYRYPQYEDVVEEVREYLAARIERALEAGITKDRIVIDPGPDLNKTTEQTLELMRGWRAYTSLGLPALAALSRKDVIGESLGLPPEERMEGSLAAAAWAVNRGARILRVHDVRATVRMCRMLEVLAGWREPAGPLVHNV